MTTAKSALPTMADRSWRDAMVLALLATVVKQKSGSSRAKTKPKTKWPMVIAALSLLLIPGRASSDPLPFVKGSYAQLLAAHAGLPVIVHIWGLSCGPCLAELPEWGALVKHRPGVRLILINADRPDLQSWKRIDATLAKAGLGGATSYVFADPFEDRLRFEIDAEWQGELPRTMMISPAGQTTTLVGVAEMATVKAWIDQAAK